MKKSFLSIVGILSAVLLFTGAVFAADGVGQIETGPDTYKVKNITAGNSTYYNPATGTCGDTFQFRVQVHNPGPNDLQNVNIKATSPAGTGLSFSSTVSISADNSRENYVGTKTAGINLNKSATLSYIPGSTQLLTTQETFDKTLPDTIFTSGVNIGTVGVSLNNIKYVVFKVKTECPPTPPENCPIPGKEHLPKDSPLCVETPSTPTTPTTPSTPAELPATGTAENVMAVLGLGALVAGSAYFVRSRRNVLG